MEEKIILAEIDIDVDASVKDAIRLKEEIKLLKSQLELARKETGENSAEYIKYNAAVKGAESELKSYETITRKVIQADVANSGSIDQLRLQLAVVSKKWSALSEEERENSDIGKKLAAQKKELTKKLEGEEKATGDARRGVGKYSEGIKEASGSITAMIPGFAGASKAASMFGMALNFALLPITAIVVVIASLIAYFKRTEEGQDQLNKIMKIFGVILNNVMDVISKFGEAIFTAIEKPKESIEKLKNKIKEIGEFFKQTFGNIIGGSIDIFKSTLEKAFASAGLAWQKFKDVFVDNSDKVKEAQKNINEANQKIEDGQNRIKEGADNLKEGISNAYDEIKKKIGEFVDETKREIEIAKMMADREAELSRIIRNNVVEEGKERLKLSKIKNEIDDIDKNSAEERLKLIDEYNSILDDQQKRLLLIANTRYELKKIENDLSASTKEDLEEEANLLANVYNVQATIESQRKESIIKRLTAQKEVYQESVKLLEAEVEAFKKANEGKFMDYDKLQKKQTESLKLQLETNLITQADYNSKLIELDDIKNKAINTRKLEAAKLDYDNQLILVEDNMFKTLDLELQGLEEKKQQELEYAESIGADREAIKEKYDNAEKEIEEAKTSAKLSLASDFANNLATIFGEQTAIGKAAAVAATTIDTFQSAQAAFKSVAGIPIVGIPLGIAAAGAAVARGIANVKKILAVKSGLPGEGSVSTPNLSAASTTAATTPSVERSNINPEIGSGIVSRSTYTNDNNNIELQPTLIEDDVTYKQKQTTQNNSTSVI